VNQSCFQTPGWYHAVPLTERLALRRAGEQPRDGTGNADLGRGRLQQWRSEPPFSEGPYFAQRLALDGLSEDDLFRLLGEPIEAVQERFPAPPAWLTDLARAFSASPSWEPAPLPEALRAQETAGLLDVIAPLIRQGRDRLHQGIQALLQTATDLPFDPGTVEDLLYASLPGPLLRMLTRTLVLELHVARLQGLLQGESPAERFRSFLRRLRARDTALTILQEYPVLARQLARCIDQWVDFNLEFLRHLCADWPALRAMFSPEEDPGVLVEVAGGAGDSHRGGRSVRIARFRSGFQLVYKPRSLAIDVHFQELLNWVNERGTHPPFRTLQVLDRGTHGWAEFVLARGCGSAAEVRRFYERQGAYLALLYALEAADVHCENLIAAGEHPILIDLEALFHPHLGGMDLRQAEELALSTLSYSVLRVGLLPQRIWSNAESEGIDLSALGAAAGQLAPRPVPFLEGAGTDEMHFTRKRLPLAGSENRPSLNGADVNVLDYTDALVSGFTGMYRLLLDHRDELLARDGPLARFAADEVRCIVRPTQTYAVLLRESFHPDVLRDALDRDRLFDRLWVPVEHLPHLARVIPAERDDLQTGDIPLFTTHPSSRDAWSCPDERIENLFDEPGLAAASRRLRQLSEQDLAQQLWFIRASLTTLSAAAEPEQRSGFGPGGPHARADRPALLAAARAVGDRLAELALHGEHDVSWIGLTHPDERHCVLEPVGLDLYGGLAGIALFLGQLGAIVQEESYAALARAALTTLRRQVERDRAFLLSIGGFSGWGGLIYGFTHLGVLWNDPTLLREAEAAVAAVPGLIERDEHLDVIAGAAGCIGGLISLYRCAPSERTLAAAVRCGDWLLARAQPMAQGIGWVGRGMGAKPLTGFSHGAAGMAWALLELAALTGEERFRAAALAAIAYERSLFSAAAGNWPDLRDPLGAGRPRDGGPGRFMTAWCHGAPGIGLARLRLLPHLDDRVLREEIDTALQTTLAHGFGHNHSLCHGDLGNLELLLQASQALAEPQWRAEVDRLAALILESIERDGWRCGVPLGVESPGLMTGLAGIGYGLLRLAEPTRVPSVLVLEPPVQYP
jgi:type 2 lantibiotic biosynthesis protein LanM